MGVSLRQSIRLNPLSKPSDDGRLPPVGNPNGGWPSQENRRRTEWRTSCMRRWSRRNRSSRGRVPRTDPYGKLSQLSADPQAPRPRPVVRTKPRCRRCVALRPRPEHTHVVRRILGARESRVGRSSRGSRHPRPRNYCVPHTGTRRVVESAGPVSIEFGAVQ